MLELATVLSSDTVNRYGSRFASGEMARGLVAHWRTGLPSMVSHDAHRLCGWTLPTMVSITPGVTRLHGIAFIPETREEQAALEARYQRHLAARVGQETSMHAPTLRALLGSHLTGDEVDHAAAATTQIAPGLARRVAPDVFATEDKDGLVDLRALRVIQPGVFRYGEFVLFAHQFFRRSLSRWNNLNTAVLSALEDLRGDVRATLRIRLDPDMVGLAASVTRALEFDYWYGPKFDDDLKNIPTGVTRHEATDRQRYFYGISRTEFWWQSRDGQHILEAEEVRDLPTLGAGAGAFGCRYVHSIIEEADGRIFHLDGAIRSYDEAALVDRLDASLADAGRKTTYTKLWRADGRIPLSHWKQLVSHYFRDNPLVGEYLSLGQDQPESADAPELDTAPAPPRERLVPHATDPGRGATFLLSLHEQAAGSTRTVQPLEAITARGVVRDIVDADVVELRKALRRGGHDLDIPADVLRIAFEDRYLTLPLVRHDAPSSVAATIDALGDLLRGWARAANDDRAIALTIAAPIAHVELRCSVYGHHHDLGHALDALRALFAARSLDDVVAWVERTGEGYRARDGERDLSRLDSMMTPQATFRVTRAQIAHDDIEPSIVENTVVHRLRLPLDDEALVGAVRAGRLTSALAWVIHKSRCTGCGGSYPDCPCSKVIDDNISQQCTDAEIAYAFWTDRRA